MPLFAFYIGRPGTWRDRLIRRVTRSPYSHVELLWMPPAGGYALAISASKRDGNCVREKMIFFKDGHWRFLHVPSLDRDEVWERAREQLGKPYDTIGAILTVTPFVTSREGLWFCTEHLGHAADLPKPHTLTPEKFADGLLELPGSTWLN